MGMVRVSGVRRSSGLEAASFSPLTPGNENAFYFNETRHRSLMDKQWHPIHAIRVGEGVSGTVRASFRFFNDIYNNFEMTFGRVRVDDVIHPQAAANIVPATYQHDIAIEPGNIIYIDAYCEGYGSTTVIEYIRLSTALPFTLFERVYTD